MLTRFRASFEIQLHKGHEGRHDGSQRFLNALHRVHGGIFFVVGLYGLAIGAKVM